MNPMAILLASACVAGSDTPMPYASVPPVAVYPVPAAAMVSHGGGCANCGTPGCGEAACESACGEPACEKPRLLDRLKALCHKDECAEPACDSCSAPVFTGFTTAAPCDGCCESSCEKPGLFARLKSKFGKHHGCDTCDAPACCEVAPECCGETPVGPTGCSLPPVPGAVYPATPTDAPQAMPVAPVAPAAPAPMPAPGKGTAPAVTPVSGGEFSIPVPLPASKF